MESEEDLSKKNLIKEYLPIIFRDIKHGWKEILFSQEIKPILNKCFKELDIYLKLHGVAYSDIQTKGLSYFIRPKSDQIFECFKYFEPQDLKLIIVGQDPYPNSEDACGLCFSSMNNKTPKSLENIFKCLKNQNLIKDIPNHGDLKAWAKQGILLINRYLTRSPEIKCISNLDSTNESNNSNITSHISDDCLHPFWKEFTNELVRYLSTIYFNSPKSVTDKNKKRYLGFFLWGRLAQELTLFIDPNPEFAKVEIFEWTHPVGIFKESDPKHFIYCDNFSKINKSLQSLDIIPINWNLCEVNPIVAAIDGGCIDNGKPKSRASYAVYFPDKFNNKTNGINEKKISDYVSSLELELDELNIKEIHSEVFPTNCRAELLALIYAFLHILKNYDGIPRPIILIEDATYGLHLVNHRIWKYMIKDFDLLNVNKNRDLVVIIRDLLLRIYKIIPNYVETTEIKDIWLRMIQSKCRQDKTIVEPDLNWNGLTIIHQNSHLQKKEIEKLSGLSLEKCKLNMIVDEMAQKLLS